MSSSPACRAFRLPPPAAAAAARPRLWELDALRGLMLVLMLSTHLPTNFGIPTSQPLGFVSAAEGFVMLSAYMAGLVYTQRYLRHGLQSMQRAFLKARPGGVRVPGGLAIVPVHGDRRAGN